MKEEARPSRLLVLAFALVFLFETWIWGSVVAAVGWLAQRIPWNAFKAAVRRQVNHLPAIVALVLFGVPLLFNEFGSLFCIFLLATGHFLTGAVGYILIKVVGLGLLAAIFDLTREKLMTLPWFVLAYEKFQTLHDFASSARCALSRIGARLSQGHARPRSRLFGAPGGSGAGRNGLNARRRFFARVSPTKRCLRIACQPPLPVRFSRSTGKWNLSAVSRAKKPRSFRSGVSVSEPR